MPEVILTTSNTDADIARTHRLGDNAYVTKPLGFEGFITRVKRMEHFWFTIIKFPPKDT